jgi:hypothetical protein
MVQFIYFYLRIIADKESRINKYLLQRDQVVYSSKESNSDDASTKSEYDDSNKDNNANSNSNNSVVPQH